MTTIRDYVNLELDRSYRKDASGMLQQVKNYATSSIVRAQTDRLIEEAERLDAAGERFDATSAELAQTIGTAGDVFSFAEMSIQANDNNIQASAFEIAKYATIAQIIANLSANSIGGNPISPVAEKRYMTILEASGIDWKSPEVDALETLTGYVETEEYKRWMAQWGAGMVDVTKKTVYSAVQKGQSPVYIARRLRDIIETAPSYVVERFTRTLQLTAYRDAETINATANAAYIAYKIRTAVKDLRTCPACIELDGTKMRVDERIKDHFHGRCYGVNVLNGQEITRQKGAEWFASLPDERQQQLEYFKNNKAAYRAYKDGVPLSAFVGTYNHELFGEMPIAKSLKRAIGEDRAKEYYVGGKK